MRATYQCLGNKIQIMDREFDARPIALDSEGIDVILGMDWLAKYDAVIQGAKRSVILTSSSGERFEFMATLPAAADCTMNQLLGNSIEDIRVVCYYSYVFHLNATLNSS